MLIHDQIRAVALTKNRKKAIKRTSPLATLSIALSAVLAPLARAQEVLPRAEYTFERGFPAPETAQRVHDEEDYERAVQA
jgi:hypothetical protein